MSDFWFRFLMAALVFAIALLFASMVSAQPARYYDREGRYVGRSVPDYAGRCCVVLDRSGQRVGRIEREQPRSTGARREPRK